MTRLLRGCLGLWIAFAGAACGPPQTPAGGAPTPNALVCCVSDEPYPPFASKNAAGEWVGLEVDFAHALAAEMGSPVRIVETAWDGIIPALQAKKFDVIIASMSITEERRQAIAFSIPYYKTPAVLLAPAGSGFRTDEASTLRGKTIGVQTGTIHHTYADAAYGGTAAVKAYPTLDDALADLAAGRADAVIADSPATGSFLEQQGAKFSSTAYPKDLPAWGEGVGVGMRKGEAELKARVDHAIRALYANGTFDRIQKKYLRDDIGTPPK